MTSPTDPTWKRRVPTRDGGPYFFLERFPVVNPSTPVVPLSAPTGPGPTWVDSLWLDPDRHLDALRRCNRKEPDGPQSLALWHSDLPSEKKW